MGATLMAERVIINDGPLRESAAGLAQVAGRVEQAVQALAAQLARRAGGPPPWGADEVGRPYGEAYLELEPAALDALRSYARQLHDAGASLTRDAQALREHEVANAATIAQVRDAGPDPGGRDG
jgi:hypothetical protein